MPHPDPRAPGPTARTWAGAVTVALAVGCVLAAGVVGPWQPEQRATGISVGPIEPPPRVSPPPIPPVDGELGPRDAPPDLGWLWQTLVVTVLVLALVLLARWLLRRQRSPRLSAPGPALAEPGVAVAAADETAPDARVLEEGARVAEQRLQDAVAPAEGVIAAWVALEDAAARSGMTRLPSATATEFTLEVLRRTPADGAAARTLLALYLRARFDDTPLTDDAAASAADAARTLVRTLSAPPPAPPARWQGSTREPSR